MVLGCVVGSLVGWTAVAHPLADGPAVSFATVARGGMSRVKQPIHAVVRAKNEWAALWARHAGPAPLPAVDFSAEMVVAVFAGERASTGYDLTITRVRLTDRGLEVVYRELIPPPGALVRPVITAPFHLIRVPRSELPVHVVREP